MDTEQQVREVVYRLLKKKVDNHQKNPNAVPSFSFTEIERLVMRELGMDIRTSELNHNHQAFISLHTYINELLVERILMQIFKTHGQSVHSDFHITAHGIQCIQKGLLQNSPIHRPNQYLDYLKSQVPNIDSRIVVYLQESLQAYNLGLYFSSSVMLGVASEALFEILIDAYINAIQSQTEKTKFSNRVLGKGISQQYDEFKKKLPDLVGKNGITGKDAPSTRRLREDFKHAIEITFDSIRSYRDYAAHPRDGVVPRHLIKGNLDAFPLFCQRLYEVIEWLQQNKI